MAYWQELEPLHSIYFAQGQSSKNIKIGLAHCPKLRVKSIQGQCTERLVLLGTLELGSTSVSYARMVERMHHNKFISTRLHGEVFQCSKELLDFIAEYCKQDHKCKNCPKDKKKKGKKCWTIKERSLPGDDYYLASCDGIIRVELISYICHTGDAKVQTQAGEILPAKSRNLLKKYSTAERVVARRIAESAATTG